MADPILLLQGEREQSLLSKIWNPAIGGLLGFGAMCFLNFGTRRPVFSGIQKHALAAGIGALAGKTIDGYRSNYLNERDAVLRHYIELHREDFPVPERKTWGEVFAPWIPIR